MGKRLQRDGHEYGWLLPSVLLGESGEGRPVRRSTRDWIVDVSLFLLACLLALVSMEDLEGRPEALIAVEQVLGALACASVWLRRRWPVALAVVTSVLTSGLLLVGGAAAVALFTVAVHRPFKISGPVLLLNALTLLPFTGIHPMPGLGYWGYYTVGVAICLTVFAWGMTVRARRQLVLSLRARAEGAAQEARRLERERIAREMHDVLAHRISILSIYAGGLEFRPDAPPEEIAKAAGAIRTSAHQALQDLREVIGVLRQTPEAEVPARPQPVLADLRSLVEECREAGMDVALVMESADGPEALGRNAYRIVQEGLTNARKHAPGAPVRVTVSGERGKGLTVEVRNPTRGGVEEHRFPAGGTGPAGPATAQSGTPDGGTTRGGTTRGGAADGVAGQRAASGIPGAGTGLIGLAERAGLAGGRLEHGRQPDGAFLLRAWLPWPT